MPTKFLQNRFAGPWFEGGYCSVAAFRPLQSQWPMECHVAAVKRTTRPLPAEWPREGFFSGIDPRTCPGVCSEGTLQHWGKPHLAENAFYGHRTAPLIPYSLKRDMIYRYTLTANDTFCKVHRPSLDLVYIVFKNF
jgi:hypothetical protein